MPDPGTCLRMWRRIGAALVLALPLALAAQPRYDLRTTQTLLPTTVLPSRVRLELDLDPERDTFGGRVSIRLRARQPVPAIVLHAQELEADSALLQGAGPARPLRVQPDAATATWRLEPLDGQPIGAGSYELDIRYRGRVQRSGEGLYRADYRVRGQPARLLATQLEAVQARRLLPVFDEPVFRCVFELSVRAPRGWEVLANMPLRQARAEGATVLHRFAPTPPMPSYLLAVSVGHFDVLAGRSGAIPLRILTAAGKREQARYALAVTQQVLPYYGRYFGRPYALPKLDQIAVPGTRQGAMEDWGLISYVEDALLYDPARSGPDTPRGVFSMLAHEIAHQWFGNLVSVASWNEIWLNEAFATWMQQKASAHFHPEWQTALHVRRDLERTLARDATPATRAIRSGPVSEDSVFEIFDGITYGKGGAVLTMLEQWIGPELFQQGLAAYMAERGLKPATAGDLWFHVGRRAGQPVAAVAASWTDQPGVPLLEVSAHCEAGSTAVTLRQSRFALAEPLAGGPWLIPVRLARGSELRTVLLQGSEQRLTLPGCDGPALRANAGGQGYYRVDYDPALREGLRAAFPALAPGDRVALLSDSYALASAGRRPLAEYFALLAALPQVHDASRAALYSLALAQARALEATFDGTPAQEALRAAGRALFGPELARLGWQPAAGEDSETQSLRAGLIRRLALLQHAPTLAAARERFAGALAPAAGRLSPSLREAVIGAVGSDADDAEFDTLLAALRATENQEERWLLVDALAAGRDPPRARRLLDEALSGRLPPDIAVALPGAVGDVPALAALAYDFSVEHWEPLLKLAGTGSFGARHWLLPGAAGGSADSDLARRLTEDQQRLDGAAGASSAETVAAAILVRHRLREREAAALASALEGWAPR